MSAGHSCIWHDMFASALDHEVYDPRRIVVKLSGGKPAGLIVADERGEEQPVSLDEVQQIKPFIISGYWNRIVFDPSEDCFKVSGSDVVKTAIPAISKRSFYQTGMVRKLEDVDNARILGFLETVVGKALIGDNSGSADLRVTRKDERTQRTPATRKRKIVTRWMREQDAERGNLTMENALVDVPPSMRRLLFEGCETPSDNS